MIGRKALIAGLLMLLLVCGTSGAVIAFYWPARGWAWLFAHAPLTTRAYLAWWLSPPLGLLITVLGYPVAGLFRRGKPVSPGERRWADGIVIVGGAVITGIEIVHVVGLFMSRAQHAAYLAAGGAPHGFHFDPQFILTRIGMAAAGLTIAWMGNRMPKLTTPTSDKQAVLQSRSMVRRIGGWIFVVAGLGMFATAFVAPFQTAMQICVAIWATSLVVWIGVSLVYRFIPPPSPTAPQS